MKLPFKPSTKLGISLSQAKRRFTYLENRLNAKPDLKKRFTDFIDEFIDMQHTEVAPEAAVEVPDGQSFYLPHHCVFKEDSTIRKRKFLTDLQKLLVVNL